MSNPMGYTHGMPVWQYIPAVSVPRAQAFYTQLLGFQFRTGEKAEAEKESTAHFTYPNATMTEKLQVGGGIKKLREGEKIVDSTYDKEKGDIVAAAYYFVDDMDGALVKVKELGGKVLVGKMSEGETGEYGVVQDTEGNALGLYGCVKK